MHTLRLIVAAWLLSLATLAWAQSDAEIAKRLVGYWQEVRLLECEEHRQRMRLNEGGTFEVTGTIDACGKKTSFVWRGKWYVKNGKFGYTTTYSNAPDQFPVGETQEDQIVSVNGSEWVMVEQSTGNKSIATRVK